MPLSALMLLEFLQVGRGQWIVQNAANGAVGKTLAMLAAARGIPVLGLVRRDDGVGEMAALGVDNVLSTATPDWMDAAKALLGDGLASVAVDSIGGRASAELMALLGENGVLVSFGALSGEPMQVPPGDMIFKQATVKGFWGSKASRDMSVDDKRRLVGELIQRASNGELRLPVEAVYDLADIAQAAAASLQPGRSGTVLLRACCLAARRKIKVRRLGWLPQPSALGCQAGRCWVGGANPAYDSSHQLRSSGTLNCA